MDRIIYINDKEISEEELKAKYSYKVPKDNSNYVNYVCIEKFTPEEVVDYLNSIEGEDLWMTSDWLVNWTKDEEFFIRTTKNNRYWYEDLLYTAYCPICDKNLFVKNKADHCPFCGHHVNGEL